MTSVATPASQPNSQEDGRPRTGMLRDALFLAGAVLVSLVLYVDQLGFYSDDWVFLSLLRLSADQSPVGLYRALYSGDVVIRQRPAQIALLVMLYSLFGLQPAGYHLANALMLVANAGLFYVAMRELHSPRFLALALPLVYGLLPHYSTDRFWIAAFQATLSMTFYFLSLYADLRAVRNRGEQLWRWKAVSVLSLLVSGLAYEVTLPLFLLNPLLTWYHARRQHGPLASWLGRKGAAVLFGSTMLALLALVGFKLAVTVRLAGQIDLVAHIASLVGGALRVNYGAYGIGLPYVLLWIIRYRPDGAVFLLGALGALLIFVYLARVVRQAELPPGRAWLRLTAVGLLVFALGYAVFIGSADVWFTSASLGNRVAIAAAVGVAASFVGALGWFSTLFPLRLRGRVFSLGIACLCAVSIMINNTLAAFWVEAYRQQQLILTHIKEDVRALPADSAFVLDGICLEHGGAYVFTGKRDVAATLALIYGDPAIRATAITNPPRVEEDGLSIFTFREYDHFPYGEKLFVYNAAQRQLQRLTNVRVARAYFADSAFDPQIDCPPGFAWRWRE